MRTAGRARDATAYLDQDARDRRSALAFAQALLGADPDVGRRDWQQHADQAYRWLQGRDSLHAISVRLDPGTPRKEGTAMTTTYNLADNAEVPFSLTGLDAKGAEVPLPAGYTAAWSLADPDSSGAVLTPSADSTTAILAGGVPDTSLMVSVVVTVPNADGSTRTVNGAEAVVVQASDAVTVGLVAGTQVPEVPAG